MVQPLSLLPSFAHIHLILRDTINSFDKKILGYLVNQFRIYPLSNEYSGYFEFDLQREYEICLNNWALNLKWIAFLNFGVGSPCEKFHA